ncbi:Hypothetical predicted protein [Olea europaea subsp. europaea]|uniref:Uncharacterized protein n=1 Tax=Olea europaea subsp. europaea TaxID=158383 RepID=A0A8S0PM66_OLEEU|nr:Hypothetical predicted protein [Olea europaea subsp. europaea]
MGEVSYLHTDEDHEPTGDGNMGNPRRSEVHIEADTNEDQMVDQLISDESVVDLHNYTEAPAVDHNKEALVVDHNKEKPVADHNEEIPL